MLSFVAVAQSSDPRSHLDDLKTRSVDSLFRNYNTDNTSGISVMVIKDGRIIYNRSFGLADIENKVPATSQTNYRIASVTKQFTAMAIMMLKEDKKLSLNDHLRKFFPYLPAYTDEITIRNMLNHTAGLPGYGDLVAKGTTQPLTDTDVLGLIRKTDTPAFKPGSRFSYSNTAYVLLGLVVEKVSGMPFKDFLRQRIFTPLKMTQTTVNSMTGSIPDRAYGYNLRDGGLKKEDQSLYSYLLGDGGIYSSVDDFYKWDQALYTPKLVKPATLKEIFTESSKETPTSAYGYGWYIDEKFGEKRVSHSGGTTGFSSYYVRYPDIRFSVIVFANQDEGVTLGPVVDAIEDIYLKERLSGSATN
ncbi:serine hydrolase domain-containing protein [Compostibacter hankyongensis]|uniref:Serine hydrolase domain-containing protein n=2 Tax=Compostibacter hankyongensis TaxID=1007089 RepID=A0ABP8FXC8_9BACT